MSCWLTWTFCRLLTTAVWHMLVSMRDRPLRRLPLQRTCAMTRVRRHSALSCLLRMHRITSELLSGMACTLGALGACTPARAMRQRCRTEPAPPLNQRAAPDTAGGVASTTCKDIRIGISESALVGRGLRQPSRGMHGRPTRKPGGLPISVTPRCGNTYGAQQSDRHLQLHRPQLYTRLCHCGRRT